MNAVTMMADLLVPPIVNAVAPLPDVQLHLHTSTYKGPIDSDDAAPSTTVAIRGGTRPIAAGMEVWALGPIAVGLYATDTYLDHHGEAKVDADLARHRIVRTDLHPSMTPWDRWLDGLGEAMPRVLIRSNNEAVHRAAIMSGRCAGFLPICSLLSYPWLRTVMEPREEWTAPLWLVCPPPETMPPSVAMACTQLRRVLARSLGGR